MSDPPEIKRRVDEAVVEVLREDPLLFRRAVSEWAVAHRLGLYLEDRFPAWDVDCEFNKQVFERQSEQVSDTKKINSDTRRPDIIIHERDDPEQAASGDNLLIIEMKVNKNSDGDIGDIENAREELGYCYGVFIDLYSHTTDPDDWDAAYLEWRPRSLNL